MRYMGSKSRIAKYIVPILQKIIDSKLIKTYIEPFCGGCNIIDKIHCSSRMAYDKSYYLIELLKNQDKVKTLPDFISRDYYSEARNSYNNQTELYPDWMIGAIGFLASYNGRFFDGGYGAEVTRKSTGKTYNAYLEAKNNLLSQDLKGIEFHCCDYQEIPPIKSALIYCDPPYFGTKQYGINKYFNHVDFWKWVREQSKNNIVITSEETAPSDFTSIWKKEVQRSIKNNEKWNKTEHLWVLNSTLDRNLKNDII